MPQTSPWRRHAGGILLHGTAVFAPDRFRLTVAQFNARAMRLYEGFGFREQSRFEQRWVTYSVLTRSAD